MIFGIHQPAISTGNLDRALAFYRDLLGFQVISDLDAEYQRLCTAGVTFHCAPQRFDTEFAEAEATYGKDPDGTIVEFQQLPDTHPLTLFRQP